MKKKLKRKGRGGKNKGNNKEVVESNLIYMYLFKDLKKDSY